MTDTDPIDQLLARSFAALPDPDNPEGVRVLVGYRTTGMPEAMAAERHKDALKTAAGIRLALQYGGYTIVPTADLTAMQQRAEGAPDRNRHLRATCRQCSGILWGANVNLDTPQLDGHRFLTAVQQLTPECPHTPKGN